MKLPNPRLQLAGRNGAECRVGGTLIERSVEHSIVWAPA